MVESIDPAQYNELKDQGYTVGIPEGLAFVFSFRTANADPASPFQPDDVEWRAGATNNDKNNNRSFSKFEPLRLGKSCFSQNLITSIADPAQT